MPRFARRVQYSYKPCLPQVAFKSQIRSEPPGRNMQPKPLIGHKSYQLDNFLYNSLDIFNGGAHTPEGYSAYCMHVCMYACACALHACMHVLCMYACALHAPSTCTCGVLCCTSPLYGGEGNPHRICSSRARRCGVSVTWHLPRRLLCRRVASGGVGWSWGAGGVVQHS